MGEKRFWTVGLENGTFLDTWNGFETTCVGGPYSEHLDIGEKEFLHCIDCYDGIGTVTWWIKKELNKLTREQKQKLKNICAYKKYRWDQKYIKKDTKALSSFEEFLIK